MKKRIYVASSWRNPHQPAVVRALREAGHEVYDFRNPPHGRGGFKWPEGWDDWTAAGIRELLKTDEAQAGFHADYDAMIWADVFVMVLPCGNSAHLEAGWASATHRPVYILTQDGERPDLMYLLADKICLSVEEVIEAIAFREAIADRKKRKGAA